MNAQTTPKQTPYHGRAWQGGNAMEQKNAEDHDTVGNRWCMQKMKKTNGLSIAAPKQQQKMCAAPHHHSDQYETDGKEK